MGKSVSEGLEKSADRVSIGKNPTELRKINKEMADLKKRLAALQARKADLEKAMKK